MPQAPHGVPHQCLATIATSFFSPSGGWATLWLEGFLGFSLEFAGAPFFALFEGWGFSPALKSCEASGVQTLRSDGPQKRQAPITVESDEAGSWSWGRLRFFSIESTSTASHPSQTQRRMGRPQELRLNFEVTCPSGIIITEAVSCGDHRYKAHKGEPPALSFPWSQRIRLRLLVLSSRLGMLIIHGL